MSTWVWTGWVVEPSNRAVQVYRSVDAVQTLEEGDVLEGDGPLDRFSVAVVELFACSSEPGCKQ